MRIGSLLVSGHTMPSLFAREVSNQRARPNAIGASSGVSPTNVAFVPARFWYLPDSLLRNIITMFVSMFLRGGWLHLGGNMLYLLVFGDNVQDRLGHARSSSVRSR